MLLNFPIYIMYVYIYIYTLTYTNCRGNAGCRSDFRGSSLRNVVHDDNDIYIYIYMYIRGTYS